VPFTHEWCCLSLGGTCQSVTGCTSQLHERCTRREKRNACKSEHDRKFSPHSGEPFTSCAPFTAVTTLFLFPRGALQAATGQGGGVIAMRGCRQPLVHETVHLVALIPNCNPEIEIVQLW
jgi:hypothetical protein